MIPAATGIGLPTPWPPTAVGGTGWFDAVGVRYTAQLLSGAYARTVFGQSYQLAGENEFDTDFYRTSGLATDTSDYVSGLYLQATQNISFTAQQRFDQVHIGVDDRHIHFQAGRGSALPATSCAMRRPACAEYETPFPP